jgi:cation transport protein ChaC
LHLEAGDCCIPRWISVKSEQGTVRALTFVAAPDGNAYARKLPIDKVAHVLARAAGHWGSCAQYLFKTATMLEEHGIRDRNIWRIQSLAAREILEHSLEIKGKRPV